MHRHTPCSCLDSLLFIRMRENALRCEMSGMWQLPPPGHQPHSVWRAASHNFYVAHISGRLCFIITQTKSWRGRYIWLFTRSEVRLCWVTSPSPRNSLMSGWGFCDTWGPGTHVTIIVWWYLIAATPVTCIMTGITMLSIDHWCSKVNLWFNKQQQIFYAALIILLEERVQSNIWRQHLTVDNMETTYLSFCPLTQLKKFLITSVPSPRRMYLCYAVCCLSFKVEKSLQIPGQTSPTW